MLEKFNNNPKTKAKELSGVMPVFQTPYKEDFSIDYDTLKKELEYLLEQGVDGVVMAMVSEVLRLSEKEQMELAEFVCSAVGGRAACVISIGAESTFQATQLASHAQCAGADAVMAIPPISTAAEDNELFDYYRAIIEAIDIPVIVQDASGYVGKPMSITMQAQLLKVFGQRIYYKPEASPIGPRLSALRDATDGKARIFEGTGGIALVDSYRRGIVGTMPGSEIIKAIIELWKALKRGDEKRIYQLSQPISALIAVQSQLDAFLAVEKHLLVKQGIFQNTLVRGPVGYVLDDETRAEVDRLYENLMEIIEYYYADNKNISNA